MKRISTIAASFIFAAVFAASAFAQAPATKIGWLNTADFGDPKEGITKYNNALNALQNEMKPRLQDLQTIDTKLKQITDDLQKMQSNPAIPVDQKAFLAKQEEGQRLQREGEFKKKDYDATVQKRSAEILGPISQDISKSVQDYAKLKGYAVILDIAALANDNFNAILALDASANITKDFIAYYNTKAPATATTAAPK